MIRWLWNNMMKWGWDFNRNLREDESIIVPSSPSGKRRLGIAMDDIESEQGLNITVRNANGGRIVTFRRYDHKTDRNQHNLYVIPDDHDFEKELGKLITLESMRG